MKGSTLVKNFIERLKTHRRLVHHEKYDMPEGCMLCANIFYSGKHTTYENSPCFHHKCNNLTKVSYPKAYIPTKEIRDYVANSEYLTIKEIHILKRRSNHIYHNLLKDVFPFTCTRQKEHFEFYFTSIYNLKLMDYETVKKRADAIVMDIIKEMEEKIKEEQVAGT